jgi:excinuclease ABC subunit C
LESPSGGKHQGDRRKMEAEFDIEEELKKLPHTSGVYIMHDKRDAIIYVGKAIDLFNRVHSYFRTGYKKTVKIQKMVSQIHHFEYIIER